MTKTDWTAEEVRKAISDFVGYCATHHGIGSDLMDIADAFANRIEADERAVPVAWLVVDAKGKRFTIYNPELAEAIKQSAEQIGSTLTVKAVCEIPPQGWYCTRPPEHDGPCAAWPNHPPAQPAQETPCSLDEALNILEHWGMRGNTLNGDDVARFRALADKIAPEQERPGWKWVPVEPTAAMIVAFWEPDMELGHDGYMRPVEIYKAMLAASPAPPKEN